ncbi:hypothetical protein [Sulfobacillus sp. hq2]|uniref:hypothetical protein n=1 Tax=Sulfobacillus sp. hq2 TaxID=2039167 RepID=UPI000CD1B10A|nr:hypothetical protein [Sulfobacillus sp. hq2]POB12189.1 hypothetical protein CO251_00755 [Sulfobacillus sp. hq2]
MSYRVSIDYTQQSRLHDDGTPQSTEYGLLIYDDFMEYFHPVAATLPDFLRILTHPALAIVILSHVGQDTVSDLLDNAQYRREILINGAVYTFDHSTREALQFMPVPNDATAYVPAAFLAEYCRQHPPLTSLGPWTDADRQAFRQAAEAAGLLCLSDELTTLFSL